MAGFGRMFGVIGANIHYGTFVLNRNICLSAQIYGISKEKQDQRMDMPSKPKKPGSPFFLFLQAERAKLKMESPHLKNKDVINIASQKWNEKDAYQKAAYHEEFNTLMANHAKEIMVYQQSLTPEQVEHLKEIKIQRAERKKKYTLKKKCEELGKPKRPPSSFVRFILDQVNKEHINTKLRKTTAELAKEWHDLDKAEKMKYSQSTKELMARYKIQLQEWEKKMVDEGHLDVIRNRASMHMKLTKRK